MSQADRILAHLKTGKKLTPLQALHKFGTLRLGARVLELRAKPFGLGGLLAAGSMVPGVGDAVGLLGDAAMYASDPKSRTWGNALMTGLGALPFVPSAQQLAELAGQPDNVVELSPPKPKRTRRKPKVSTEEGMTI